MVRLLTGTVTSPSPEFSEEPMGRLPEFNALIGRARCRSHALDFQPREHNQSRRYYFLAPERLPDGLLCGACLQGRGDQVRGGLVVSEESRATKLVVFQGFAGYRLSEDNLADLTQIWPRP